MSKNGRNHAKEVFTIGHSNHPIEKLSELLTTHRIEVLVDTRSQPYSKYSPQFDREALKTAVQEHHIKYLFLGKELGGRPQGDEFYDPEGHVLYSEVAKASFFLEGIRRVESGTQKFRVALLCSEENPTSCHRRLLVGRVLAQDGFRIDHIRGDGRVQSEQELIKEEAASSKDSGQAFLFTEVKEEPAWRSTRSVLPKKPHPSSSTH